MRSARRAQVAVVAAFATGAVGAISQPAGATTTTPVAPAFSCPIPAYGVQNRAPGTGKTVALTFDDGPGPSTDAILAILKRKQVRATFFNLGVHESTHPTTVRVEANSAVVLGNHGWGHTLLTSLSVTAQAAEIDRQISLDAGLVGRPSCLFRPAYGAYNATTLTLAQQRRMAVWRWSVDPEDWRATGSGSAYWVSRIISRATAGASQLHPVILLHNQIGGNPATVAALGPIIDFYRAHGYAFVDLMGRRGYPSGSAFGSYDGLARWPGGLVVRGWAIDRSTTASTLVDVYLDGRGKGRYRAAEARPDVARVYPAYGPAHGFAAAFAHTAAGSHTVCVYAVNTVGPGDDGFLGCRVIVVGNVPRGHLDVAAAGDGVLTVSGWALDPDTAAPIAVVISVDGRALAPVVANLDRPDVGRVFPGWGNSHGFRSSVPIARGTHSVCVTAVNVGPGSNTCIACVSVAA